MGATLIRHRSSYLFNEVVRVEELMETKQLIQRQKTKRLMKAHKETRELERCREHPKEYKTAVIVTTGYLVNLQISITEKTFLALLKSML